MDEIKEELSSNDREELKELLDDVRIRTMTITIEEINLSFTIACSQWTNEFRDFTADWKIEEGHKDPPKIIDGSIYVTIDLQDMWSSNKT